MSLNLKKLLGLLLIPLVLPAPPARSEGEQLPLTVFPHDVYVCGSAWYWRVSDGIGLDRDWRFSHRVWAARSSCNGPPVEASYISIADIRNGQHIVNGGTFCENNWQCQVSFEIDDRRGGGTSSSITVVWSGYQAEVILSGYEYPEPTPYP